MVDCGGGGDRSTDRSWRVRFISMTESSDEFLTLIQIECRDMSKLAMVSLRNRERNGQVISSVGK